MGILKPITDGISRLTANARQDGWESILTGLGTARAKNTSLVPVPDPLSYQDSLALYRATDTGARLVDIPAEDMTRAGWDIRIPDDHEGSEAVGAAMDDLEWGHKVQDAIKKTRAFGGAVVLVGAQDGSTDLSKPLNENAITSIDFLTVFDPSEVTVNDYVSSVGAKDFGDPATYQFHPFVMGSGSNPGLERVHNSRVLLFRGPYISRLQVAANRCFGDSIFDLVWKVIREFDSSFENSGALIQDFAQAVFKIKGLAEAVAGDRADIIKKRLELMDMSRSILRALALDADGEDFERKPTPLTGLPEMLDRFSNRLAAAARIPVTRLMGQAPAGLNATGAADEKAYFDFISSQQHSQIKRPSKRLARLIMLSKGGPTNGIEPKNWSMEFRPLFQPTQLEQAQTRQTMAASDQIYLVNGVLSADEVRQSRFAGDHYSVETAIEAEDLSESDPLAEAEGVPRIGPDGEPLPVMPGQVAPKPGSPQGGAPGAAGGGPMGTGGEGAKVQDLAMNGAQVTSLIDVVSRYHAGEIPRESAIAIVRVAFRLSDTDAAGIIGPVDFEPVKPEPPVIAGFGAKPGAPGAKPPPAKKPAAFDAAPKMRAGMGAMPEKCQCHPDATETDPVCCDSCKKDCKGDCCQDCKQP